MLVIFALFSQNPYSDSWSHTREPGPKKIPYSGTWESGLVLGISPILVYVLKFPSTGDNKKHPIFALLLQ